MIFGSSAAMSPISSGVVDGWILETHLRSARSRPTKVTVAHGSASAAVPPGEYRPSADTANWSLAAAVGWISLAFVLDDFGMLFPAAMCLSLWLQCRQRIVVEGTCVHRVGL